VPRFEHLAHAALAQMIEDDISAAPKLARLTGEDSVRLVAS
jgi:hypothetical protein